MMYHPNFPPSLSITPNQTHSSEDDADTFGVEAQREAISRYGIAGRVWEAAHVLCAYVDPIDDGRDFDPPFQPADGTLGVIELGSGTGVVAAHIARAIRRGRSGGFVIATDLPDVCPLLRHNLGTNASSKDSDSVFVRPLAWGNRDHVASIIGECGSRRLTHVVCCDLVYFPELLGPLLRTLIYLSLPSPSPKIIISYKIRSLPKEAPFWTAFGLWFSFQPVLARRWVRPIEKKNTSADDDGPELWRQLGADEDEDRTFVFVAHRRPESVVWHVPESDEELMQGVGARGTTATMGDDTFETILFMAMGIDHTSE